MARRNDVGHRPNCWQNSVLYEWLGVRCGNGNENRLKEGGLEVGNVRFVQGEIRTQQYTPSCLKPVPHPPLRVLKR